MIILRLLFCVLVLVSSIYIYIDRLNQVTLERLKIPELNKELKNLKEEITRLQYEVDLFENPIHLMELSAKSEFSHLKFPYRENVIAVEKK